MDPRRFVYFGGDSQEGKITVYFNQHFSTTVHEGDDGSVCRISCSSEKKPDLSDIDLLKNRFTNFFIVLGLGLITVAIPEFFGVPFWLQWFVIFTLFSAWLYFPSRTAITISIQ